MWDLNIPCFMGGKNAQETYDYFMALKSNISNIKIMAVLLHRLCGDYSEDRKVAFTDMFKQLKQWIFGSYRTEEIPPVSYTSLWKSWKLVQEETQKKKMINLCDKYYQMNIKDFVDEDDFMYVSTTPVNKPVYYLCKPEKMVIEEADEPPENNIVIMNLDSYGNPIIPKACDPKDEVVQVSALMNYLSRHFVSSPCDYCNQSLCLQTIIVLSCNHIVHKSCRINNYKCPTCHFDNWRERMV